MQQKIAFIGCGNMGKAILAGLLASGQARAQDIWVYTPTAANVARLQAQYQINPAQSARQAVAGAALVFVAVKPYQLLAVMADLAADLAEQALIISLAAGITLDQLAGVLGGTRKIVRAMPNTPALVQAAMTSVTVNQQVNEQEAALVLALFRGCGEAQMVSEEMIHAVVGVSGSAPAYVFMFIEALADAAVLGGMPRSQAYQFAAQAVFGAAKMVRETGLHPAQLKDQVCSPGGTTIEAVQALEACGLRHAVMQAVSASIEKSKRLSGE